MKNGVITLQNSKVAVFFNSFSAGTRAALLFAIPFTLVDSLHYYTAGTAIVFSLPLLFVFYLLCGFLAARLQIAAGGNYGQAARQGFWSGIRLWCFSTLVNTFISLLVGAFSLGLSLVLGIPYLLLCAPVLLVLGAFVGLLGASLCTFFDRRTR